MAGAMGEGRMRRPCESFVPAAASRRCRVCNWRANKHRPVKRVVCEHTGKIRYATAPAAKVALHRLSGATNENEEIALRLMPYRCDSCHGWHIGHGINGADTFATTDTWKGPTQ